MLTTDSNKTEQINGIFTLELEILNHATAEAQLYNQSTLLSFQITAKETFLEPEFPSVRY